LHAGRHVGPSREHAAGRRHCASSTDARQLRGAAPWQRRSGRQGRRAPRSKARARAGVRSVVWGANCLQHPGSGLGRPLTASGGADVRASRAAKRDAAKKRLSQQLANCGRATLLAHEWLGEGKPQLPPVPGSPKKSRGVENKSGSTTAFPSPAPPRAEPESGVAGGPSRRGASSERQCRARLKPRPASH
jgi:hypothetical protein